MQNCRSAVTLILLCETGGVVDFVELISTPETR
jgi:hypothetical protein